MQEVTQAAQRLRRWKQDQFHCNMQQVADARKTLADAWLAEHAEDDDEAITEDWWHSQCCVETLTIPIDDEWYVSWNRFNGTILNSDSDAWMLEHITTRGQLRLLLRSLS